MRIAIIGAGIAGNVAAHALAPRHDITVFEAESYAGGHTNTVRIDDESGTRYLDTGFIVFNFERYPRFTELLRELGIASRRTTMSFSVRSNRAPFEYSSQSLFAFRRNLFDPRFARMLADIVRFNRASRALIDGGDDILLGDYLMRGNYSSEFIENFLYPMGAAIWSCDPARMATFPARFFARFFENHRFLDLFGQPEWRVVSGGSFRYVEALTRPLRDRIHLSARVVSVRRTPEGVLVQREGGEPQRFDHVVMALHGDHALSILEDATQREREILGAFEYQENLAVLHTDTSVLPRRRRAWAAWNASVPDTPLGHVSVSYDLNILQGFEAEKEYIVTLNDVSRVAPELRLKTIRYRHPLYSQRAVAAQKRRHEISGQNRASFCGAYWGFGFHEDGVVSGLAVARELEGRA